MTIDTSQDPGQNTSERTDEPGSRGTYGQGDFAPSAQRSRLRKDQHFAPGGADASDSYGEGGFAGGGETPDDRRQSGYGGDFGQLEGAQRHEKQASELDYRKPGTGAESSR